MISFLLIPLYALCNRAWGAGLHEKWKFAKLTVKQRKIIGAVIKVITAAIMATALWLCVGVSYWWLPLLIVSQWLIRIFGRGKWFPHTGFTFGQKERISVFIDPLARVLSGVEYNARTPDNAILRYKTVATGLAWSLLSIPKFVLMAFILTPWALVGIPLMLMIGLIYLVCFKLFPNKYENDKLVRDSELPSSEIATGAWMGAIDALLVAI